ncbi:conserved Plasmodium protein, unknown function [Plasmodium knowlesi strain H]|uniref:Uncharacterized protein n=3 Tax=Plasmodium knowlesi TaxID=5850 RepID=A0A5K1V9T0_PLAKH|nr:conserved Plasmodium protein, unknown function [Plasmodium knowlesi strain H]OTN68143.1 Uncharacterized protein PKNOH_S04350700 [Plasmodium knowlesi]CAA9990180.1 conserved Plasmodium protein, unknown function [Plasmodium knowlesi strain H]SBO27461.1 conserved Plasmodium protein, unknown function [Plasmodium knowlesi strain H]SBO28496.1 conserved Plasmodium protein, unknown function [Plasmodium knowlesi strain H]VVS79654.1 conserved Plasmodium protein, unknown function [Plasmodium knowlesi s|eukprot:XP_002258121.1 hypothetical protein, conserved in Plasmodium species [Plasmodium knowlesi strain H]
MKRIAISRGVFSTVQRRCHDVQTTWRRHYFSSMKDISGLKNAILNYADSVEDLVQRREEHEAKVKAIFEDHWNGYPGESEMLSLFLGSCEKEILNGEVSNIESYVQDRRANGKNINLSKGKEGQFLHRTKLLRILTTCGIRVSPKVLLYYVLEAVTQLKTHLEEHKFNIIKDDAVTKRENYVRINSYYYDKEKVHVPFMPLYKALSNVLYSVSESRIESVETYEHLKDQVIQNYMNIEDVVRKAPAFLNISVFFFLVNSYIYLGKNIKIKNLCIDVLNPYVSAISEDEMNISSDDTFYLILALRLYFSSLSYNSDALNQLNIYNKQFVSSILSLPNHSDGVYTDQNEKYAYITEFLNRQDKAVELKKVHIPPFNYSLTSLKNQTLYILDSARKYYANEASTLRSCVFWRYYLAAKDGFTLVRLCQKEDYNDLFTESKRDEVLQASISQHYLYDCDQLVRPPGKKNGEVKG